MESCIQYAVLEYEHRSIRLLTVMHTRQNRCKQNRQHVFHQLRLIITTVELLSYDEFIVSSTCTGSLTHVVRAFITSKDRIADVLRLCADACLLSSRNCDDAISPNCEASLID